MQLTNSFQDDHSSVEWRMFSIPKESWFQFQTKIISNFPSRWRNKMLTNIVIDPFLLSINFFRLWCPQWHNRWMISHITGTSGISVKLLCYFKGATKRKSLKKTFSIRTWGGVKKNGSAQQGFLEIQDNQLVLD